MKAIQKKRNAGGSRCRVLGAALALALAAGMPAAEQQTPQTRTIERKFELADPSRAELEVDNVFGPIRVTGYDGRTIELKAVETVRGDSPDKIEQARREVRLDIKQDGNSVVLYVDGPFRCNCGDGGGRNSVNFRRHPGYTVAYDFELRVPAATKLTLRTINEGGIHVENAVGDFDVENINGAIEMVEVSGSGRAYALNGGLKATFRANPKADSYFGSLNGPVDVFFQPGLSADLRFKTFNGGVYTDFPLTALPAGAVASERRNGKFVYRADKYTGARVGRGGPEIKFDGFNGDIRVHQRSS